MTSASEGGVADWRRPEENRRQRRWTWRLGSRGPSPPRVASPHRRHIAFTDNLKLIKFPNQDIFKMIRI